MRDDTVVIDIVAQVTDDTATGAASATKNVSKLEESMKRVHNEGQKLQKMSKLQMTATLIDKASKGISAVWNKGREIAGKLWSVTVSVIDKVTAPIRGMISKIGDLIGIAGIASAALGGLTVANALSANAASARYSAQFATVAKNVGIDEIGQASILRHAQNLSNTTMYGGSEWTAAAAEFATYISDPRAIEQMMDVLGDYAAGMSGGVELTAEQLVDYATQLGKLLNAEDAMFDGIKKKGFTVSEAQEEILKTSLTSDLEKSAVAMEIIQESWGGLAREMAATPLGKMAKIKNQWSDILSTLGAKLQPAASKFFDMLEARLPGIGSLLTRGADSLNNLFERILPGVERGLDNAIRGIERFGRKISGIVQSPEFQEATLFGKVKILWDEIITKPFVDWWETKGRQVFIDKAADIGRGIGSGITRGLLALLGFQNSDALADGKSIGGSFIDGFVEGFDTEKIWEALKTWADEHKALVAGLGTVLGVKLVGGIIGAVSRAKSTFDNLFGGRGGTTGASGGIPTMSTANMTVPANIVNVYGNMVNNAGGRMPNVPVTGVPRLPQLPGGGGQLALPGAAGAAGAAKGLTSATGWLGKLLQLGSTSSVIGANGTLLAVKGGVGGMLGGLGGALGTGATTAAGAAAAGLAGGVGILGGLIGVGKGIWDIFQGSKIEDDKDRKTRIAQGASGIGMVGAGAGIGAAIGSVVPVVGTAIGAAVGAGIGGIASLFTSGAIGKAISDWTDEGGWMNNFGKAWMAGVGVIGDFFTKTIPETFSKVFEGAKQFFTQTIPAAVGNVGNAIKGFFTETIPEKWNELWTGVGNFFTKTVPYALGYAVGKIQIFFTETIPRVFGSLWDGVMTFFTQTIPAALSTIGTALATFFTQTIPEFFGNIWRGVAGFFTETIPAALSVVGAALATFFTETVPAFFGSVWDGITGFFTETIPAALTVVGEALGTFFMETVPEFFGTVWEGISTFFTETIPEALETVGAALKTFFTETIPNFFGNLWSGVTRLVTETIPAAAQQIGSSISNFFTQSIPQFFGSVWDKVKGFFGGIGEQFSAGYEAATATPHAQGGYFTSPHKGLVAEDGPEFIIPVGGSRRKRGLALWEQAGRMLGVRTYADGGLVGAEPATAATASSGAVVVPVTIDNVTFEVNFEGGSAFDEETIIQVLKANVKNLTDEIAQSIALSLQQVFANLPRAAEGAY